MAKRATTRKTASKKAEPNEGEVAEESVAEAADETSEQDSAQQPTESGTEAAQVAVDLAQKFRAGQPVQTPMSEQGEPASELKPQEVSYGVVTHNVDLLNDPRPGHTLYRSAEPEATRFEVQIAGKRLRCGYAPGDARFLEFQVPNELAERFDVHHFVVTGRLVKVAEG